MYSGYVRILPLVQKLISAEWQMESSLLRFVHLITAVTY